MHNTYHFLKYLSAELQTILPGMQVSECFSQQKDELILIFEGKHRPFFIQAQLRSDFTALYFPEEFHRAKRNWLNLFPEVKGKTVKEVKQIQNDRAFVLILEGDIQLLFKLHGSRANVVLFEGQQVHRLLRPKLRNDLNLSPDSLDKEADHSFEKFQQEGLKKTFFTLGKDAEKILLDRGFNNLDAEGQYQLVLHFLDESDQGIFYITNVYERYILSLVNTGEVLEKYNSAIAASNGYYHAHYRYNYIYQLKEKLFGAMDKVKKRSQQYIDKCEMRLEELEKDEAPEKIADVIMANLHAIPSGAEKVKLYNFYKDQDTEIKLKKDLSPQKYAELLYKKGKRRPLEVQKLWDLIEEKSHQIGELEADRNFAVQADTHKLLQPLLVKYLEESKKDDKDPEDRFKTFAFMGWQVYVGKNAANNDELTMKFAHKDDLWLHARDVSGSHVVVKHKSGQNFPKPVIEKAASVAAFYSQRKNDSLCPVIYTLKKFVRKVKGAPKGAVRVDKEQVVMVVPAEI